MLILTNQQINEIAQDLDCGFKCYLNKKTGELISIPDELKNPEMDTEDWLDEIEKIENNIDNYYEIDPLKSSDSFKIMEDFAYTLDDSNSLKDKLIQALSKRKPFREFKFVIDNSDKYRQKWFDFKNQELQNWVSEKVNEINNED